MNIDNDKNRDDVMRDTLKHVRGVGFLILEAVSKLNHRAMCHDDSKFSEEEFPIFVEQTSKLKGMTYASPEYDKSKMAMKPALDHHYANNQHHPEFWENDVNDMTLIDLIEMLADWKAATERHHDGNLMVSIEKNADRFNYDNTLKNLLIRTAVSMGWI